MLTAVDEASPALLGFEDSRRGSADEGDQNAHRAIVAPLVTIR